MMAGHAIGWIDGRACRQRDEFVGTTQLRDGPGFVLSAQIQRTWADRKLLH
jgi:hypothetical protein